MTRKSDMHEAGEAIGRALARCRAVTGISEPIKTPWFDWTAWDAPFRDTEANRIRGLRPEDFL